MAIAVNIDEVKAPDAAPTTAPNKISNKATKNSLTFKFTATAASPILAWRARLAPTNRNTGTLLGKRGMVCGSGDVCGHPLAMSVSIPSGTQITEDATYAEAAKSDGEYEVKVWAISESDGWSS